jgi:hypothetical protein
VDSHRHDWELIRYTLTNRLVVTDIQCDCGEYRRLSIGSPESRLDRSEDERRSAPRTRLRGHTLLPPCGHTHLEHLAHVATG